MSVALPVAYAENGAVYDAVFGKGRRSVIFTAAEPREGTSTVAYALAQRAAAGGQKVLYVDFNTHSSFPVSVLALPSAPWSLGDAEQSKSAEWAVPGSGLTLLPAPTGALFGVAQRDPALVRAAVSHWLERFDLVIADAPCVARPNMSGIPTDILAQGFDAAVLVVATDITGRATVQSALAKLQDADVPLAGVVMNDQAMPILRDELKRQAARLPERFGIRRGVMALLDRIGLLKVAF